MCSYGGTRDEIVGVADGKRNYIFFIFHVCLLQYFSVLQLLKYLHILNIDDFTYAGADCFVTFPSGRPK